MITNLDSIVQTGRKPWLPSDAACELDVWNQYDMPLTGTYVTEKGCVLFTTAYELTASSITVWRYIPLTDLEYIEWGSTQYEEIADMYGEINSLFAHRPSVYAIADNFSLNNYWVMEGHCPTFFDGANVFLDVLLKAQRKQKDERLARMDKHFVGPMLIPSGDFLNVRGMVEHDEGELNSVKELCAA